MEPSGSMPTLSAFDFFYTFSLPSSVTLLTALRNKCNVGNAHCYCCAVPDAEADRIPITAVRPPSRYPIELQSERLQIPPCGVLARGVTNDRKYSTRGWNRAKGSHSGAPLVEL